MLLSLCVQEKTGLQGSTRRMVICEIAENICLPVIMEKTMEGLPFEKSL